MESIDQRLSDVGIQALDVEMRLDGSEKALVLTERELVYLDQERVQRVRLRDITKVQTTKTAGLNIRVGEENAIEGSIRGFDVTELKLFFDAVKTSIARAKATATGTNLPGLSAISTGEFVEPAIETPVTSSTWDSPINKFPNLAAETPSAVATSSSVTSSPATSDDWGFEKTSKDSWADLDAALRPATSGGLPPIMEAMTPPPADSPMPVVHNVDPFADLIRTPTPSKPDSFNDAFAPTVPSAPSPAVTTGVMVSSSPTADWSGDTLDAKNALNTKAAKDAADPISTNSNQIATMRALSRALYWLSIIFMFASLSIPAVLLQNQNRDLIANAVILAAFVGGLLVTFIGLGISELLGAWAKAAGDLRSIRKATLGH
jgi:hypothetical protein